MKHWNDILDSDVNRGLCCPREWYLLISHESYAFASGVALPSLMLPFPLLRFRRRLWSWCFATRPAARTWRQPRRPLWRTIVAWTGLSWIRGQTSYFSEIAAAGCICENKNRLKQSSCWCCSHIKLIANNNAARSHRTGSNHSWVEEYLRKK